MSIQMNAAQAETIRNERRAAIQREYDEVQFRNWTIEYRYKNNSVLIWANWHAISQWSDIEVPFQLKYLRSKWPQYEFRAAKTITVSYKRTIIRID